MKPATFLREIWGLQQGEYFFLATKSKNGRWKDHPFKAPVQHKQITAFLERYHTDEYNLYFCPHGFSRPERKKQFATGTSFLWADLDESDPRKCDPVPQVAWESSPGRFAALWKLNDFFAPGDVEETNRALSYANGADPGGWDFTQVLRIPGTRNHKYKASPEGKLLWYRDNQYNLGDFPDAPGADELDPMDVLSKSKRKMKPETYRLLTAKRPTQGKRSEVIWRLENDLHEQGLTQGKIFTLIKHSVWNKFAGRRDEDGQLRRELEKVHGKQDRPSIAGGTRSHRRTDDDEAPRSSTLLVRLSDVEAENIEWLWYPYIPLGKLTIIEGDPGLGKSWVTMALTSHVSQRKKFPEQEKPIGGKVLLMSAEDGLGDTIRPRLDTMEANVRNVFAIDGAVSFDEDGCDEVERYIKDLEPRLVIVDPLVAYLGGQVDMHKANETREVMARMARIAQKYQVAIVCIRHLTKGGRDKSIYRGLGSIDITAAARSVVLVGRSPDDPDEGRVLCHIKSNLAPLGQAMSYALRPGSGKPFRWEGPVEFTAEEIFKVEPTGGKGEYAIAMNFVKEALADGPVLADEVRRDSEAKGITTKMVNRAKRDLGVRGVQTKEGMMWRMNG